MVVDTIDQETGLFTYGLYFTRDETAVYSFWSISQL